jgi:hypothetical protein
LKVDLGTSGAQIVTKYHLKAPLFTGYAFPKDFTLQGSNNDSDWTTLSTQTSVTDPGQDTEITPVRFANTTAYRYYKLNVTDRTSTGDIAVGEMRMLKDSNYTEDMGA